MYYTDVGPVVLTMSLRILQITVANDSSGSVLAIRVVNQLNDVTVHADGNYARIEDRVCCQVYLKTSYLKRTKLCQTNNTSEDIVCNDATTDPACRSYVQWFTAGKKKHND